MKRFLSIVILVSMTLHCASRLGVLSYLYENRHEIAYQAGLIAEIPVAMCTGNYFEKNAPLVIHEADTDESKQVPGKIASAKEITLFSHSTRHSFTPFNCPLLQTHNTALVKAVYDQPLLTIFHPPC